MGSIKVGHGPDAVGEDSMFGRFLTFRTLIRAALTAASIANIPVAHSQTLGAQFFQQAGADQVVAGIGR